MCRVITKERRKMWRWRSARSDMHRAALSTMCFAQRNGAPVCRPPKKVNFSLRRIKKKLRQKRLPSSRGQEKVTEKLPESSIKILKMILQNAENPWFSWKSWKYPPKMFPALRAGKVAKLPLGSTVRNQKSYRSQKGVTGADLWGSKKAKSQKAKSGQKSKNQSKTT